MISNKILLMNQIIIGGLIALLVVQLLSITFSYILCKAIRNREIRYYA